MWPLANGRAAQNPRPRAGRAGSARHGLFFCRHARYPVGGAFPAGGEGRDGPAPAWRRARRRVPRGCGRTRVRRDGRRPGVGLESGVAAERPIDPVRDGPEPPAHATTANADPAAHADPSPNADTKTDTDSHTSTDAAANCISDAFTDSTTNASTDARADTGPDRPSGAEGATHERPHAATRRRCPSPGHVARGRAAGGGLSSGGGDCPQAEARGRRGPRCAVGHAEPVPPGHDRPAGHPGAPRHDAAGHRADPALVQDGLT